MGFVFVSGGVVPNQGGRMFGMNLCHANAFDGLDRARFVHAWRQLCGQDTQGHDGCIHVAWRIHGCVVELGNFGGISKMIPMPMRDQQDIDVT